ncbi:hypothetical protein FB451DRAFT_379933 [Mycena latifolia]|nr:hypothetical protein FB451DRAFT_379933 [Mycena latifolia]
MDSDSVFTLTSDLLVSYVDVAFLALLTYDTLLNIGKEYRHIWRSKWGLIKCLYLWARYSTFIDTVFAVQKRFVMSDPSSCSFFTDFDTIFAGVGIGIVSTPLYALYERSQRLLGFFLIMWFSIGGLNIWAVMKRTESLQKVPPNLLTSCNDTTSSNIGLVSYMSLLAGETVIVLLTLWKGFHTHTFSRSADRHTKFGTSFYHDGVLFYLVMLRKMPFFPH